jgi:hypothetical protein
MRRQHFLAFPTFDKHEPARLLHVTMQIVLKRTLLLARRRGDDFERFAQLLFIARHCHRDCDHRDFGHACAQFIHQKRQHTSPAEPAGKRVRRAEQARTAAVELV